MALLIGFSGQVFNTLSDGRLEDPMMASGLTFTVMGLGCALLIEPVLRGALRRMAAERIVDATSARYAAAIAGLEMRSRRYRLLGTGLITALMILGFLWFYRDVEIEPETIVFAVSSVILGGMVGHRLGTIFAFGRLAKMFEAHGVELHLVPGHPDRAGGLASLGRFLLFQGVLSGLILVWLSFWLIFMTRYAPLAGAAEVREVEVSYEVWLAWMYEDWTVHLSYLWIVAAAYFTNGFSGRWSRSGA